PADPATDLTVDPDLAAALAGWIAFGDTVLRAWVAAHVHEPPAAVQRPHEQPPAEVQLWPENFDLGTELGPDDGRRANYGASPGDAGHALPYLYVGPWVHHDDPFWDAGAFARLGLDALLGTADPAATAAAFFHRGHQAAAREKS